MNHSSDNPNNPFLWKKYPRPSVFNKNHHFNGVYAQNGEKARGAISDGKIQSSIYGLSEKANEQVYQYKKRQKEQQK